MILDPDGHFQLPNENPDPGSSSLQSLTNPVLDALNHAANAGDMDLGPDLPLTAASHPPDQATEFVVDPFDSVVHATWMSQRSDGLNLGLELPLNEGAQGGGNVGQSEGDTLTGEWIYSFNTLY